MTIKNAVLKAATRAALRARRVAVLGVAGGLLLSAAPAVFAQSAVGSVYGQADAGSTVTITDTGTGLTRTLTVGSTGQFSFAGLPTGNYAVSVKRDGKEVAADQVRVAAGAGTAVTFDVQTVVVSASRVQTIDVSTTQVATTFTAEQLHELPIAPNVTAVALLAPGAIRGDTTLGVEGLGTSANLASFGGSSVAENSYYINGFNVTNLFKNLSYSQVPFYAIDTQQVLTGGYGPQYGMSTGGVVAVTTRKGTNEFEIGAAVSYSPDALQEQSPRTYTPQREAYRDYSQNERNENIYDLWIGGPIIQDKLFFFAVGELTDRDRLNYPNSYYQTANVQDQHAESPFWLADVTWHISDNHIVDFTAMDDTRKYTTKQFGDVTGGDGFVTKGDFLGTQYEKFGGRTYIGSYHGQITDDLAVSLSYGDLTSVRETYQRTADGSLVTYNGVIGDFNQPGCPWIYAVGIEGVNSCFISSTIPSAAGEDTRKNGRADISYSLDAGKAGVHTLQVGYEKDEWRSFDGESYAGGAYFRYYDNNEDALPDYVRVRHFQTGADVGVDTESYYLSDDWKATDNLLLTIGVRNDSFENLNGDGVAYAKQDDIWQPRLGFAWDVTGDQTKKLYGSYGIYSLPIAATVAVRGASASLYDTQNWNFDSIDPATGRPHLTTPRGALGYLNSEDGSTPNPSWVASNNLDPTIQEEFILGYQMELAPNWTAGIKGTYRNLKKTIDDMCDTRPFEAWADQNLGAGSFDPAAGTPGCFMFNPGSSMSFSNMDLNNDGTFENVTLTPEMINSPKAKRKYYSVEMSLEKTMSDRWYMRGSYTWAQSYGNAEGLVNSDNGQDDTGVTIAFDFPELMTYANGYLPNDRRHTIKLLGAYQITPEFTVSTNLLAQSGRPMNCVGVDQTVDDAFHYDASYFYCNGTPAPRGSIGRTGFRFDLDLGLSYAPTWAPGLALQAQVFNLFNLSADLSRDETGEFATFDDDGLINGTEPYSSYLSNTSYQPPRYVMLSAQYKFNFGK
ncbi:MAG: carboxypeptidase regulatory-like domain-containing protein [Povalibacter sp.]